MWSVPSNDSYIIVESRKLAKKKLTEKESRIGSIYKSNITE